MADVSLLLREVNAARNGQAAADGAGRKRKALSTLSHSLGRKKPKSVLDTPGFGGVVEEEEETDEQNDISGAAHDAELAALDRDLALLDAATSANNIVLAVPAVSAAPMTAADIAAQVRVDQNEQRGRKEVEREAEREDAARALEEEFEAMDGLEGRAKKLRERREALRTVNAAGQQEGSEVHTTRRESPHSRPIADGTITPENTIELEDDDDDEEEDDDIAGWNFGAKA